MNEKKHILSLDLETYSDVDLGQCGVFRYVEGDFHIMLLAYAFDDEDVHITDIACGEPIPQEVVDAIHDPAIIKTAWNAQFERTCLSRYFGTRLSPDSWQCSMVWAASLSLPLKLKTAAEVLKTGEQKDDAGERLIRYFSVPCRPTKSNGGRTRNLPEHAPEDWELFKSYCKQDVRTERDIRKRLERFPLPDSEWDYYHMDQRINDRGILIDRDLVEQAITCDMMLAEEMTAKAYELTGLENPNSVSQLKNWLVDRGIAVESLGKKDVAAMISNLDKNSTDQEALDMLKLRLRMAKSSVKKYQAAERYICSDGRAHGLFQFSGANRTQRWAGRGIQIQNLAQNHISTLDEARELVKMGCFNMVESIYGNTPDILSQLCRTMLIPKPGCEFIVCDFSAIEARVLAFLAGEQWRLDAFKRGEDIYCASASQMFGVPVVKHGVNGELRQKGKVAELACIAEGGLVLTDRGEIPIEEVTTDMKVWDGEEWVNHEGVVYRGERETITYDGLTATPDHLVWVEGESRPVRFDCAATCGIHLLRTGDGGKAIRLGDNYQSGKAVESKKNNVACINTVSKLWDDKMDSLRALKNRTVERMQELFATMQSAKMVIQATATCKNQMPKSSRSRIPKLRGTWDKVRLSKCFGSRAFFDWGIWCPRQKDGDRQSRLQRELCSRESEICRSENKLWEHAKNSIESFRTEVLAVCKKYSNCETLKRDEPGGNNKRSSGSCRKSCSKLVQVCGKTGVYDIRNAGGRHRFTVSGKLVHNCGYGGSAGALISMGALDQGLKESELPDIIESWRAANPKIVQFWWDVEKAAIDTVKDHQDRKVRNVGFQFSANTLWIVLPSGRRLAYIKPKLQPNRFGRMAITFEGLNAANKWSRGETYSGRLVENITQATARDLLAEAMWRMEQAGLHIVGHVHDEVILEVPKGTVSVGNVCKIMNRNPEWAKGLPLSSDGYVAPAYYYKS